MNNTGTRLIAFVLTLSAWTALSGRPAVARDAVAADTCGSGSTSHCVDASIGKSVTGHNRMTIGVTLCPVGATDRTRCRAIPHVMVDTGSTGLRIQATAIRGSVHDFAPALSRQNRPLVECQKFVGVHNYAWGSIRRADVYIGTEVVHDLAVEFVNDPDYRAPRSCRSNSTVTSNGTLGIGWRRIDALTFQAYGSSGNPTLNAQNDDNHLHNPVAMLATHNNGEVFDFPALKDGDTSVPGTITFGVDTDASNTIPASASYVPLDRNGHFTTTLFKRSYPDSYIDSGTTDLTFASTQIRKCPGTIATNSYFNPSNTYFAATLHENPGALPADGTRDPDVAIRFLIADQPTSCNAHPPDVGYTATGTKAPDLFVWGAPFFIGRRVFLVQGRNAGGSSAETGQLYAFGPE